jgi:predicted patatin/cPLA2 family phospholipase
LNTGETLVFDEEFKSDNPEGPFLASASIPLVFEPVTNVIKGRSLVDGGIHSNIEFDEGILKCLDLGFPEEKIIVDALMCNDHLTNIKRMTAKDVKYSNAYDSKKRANALKD